MKTKKPTIVIIGPCLNGKTFHGKALARLLSLLYGWNVRFREPDDFHSPENVAKMRSGQSLTDDDRWGWLRKIRRAICFASISGKPQVFACSALKRSYRDVLRGQGGHPVYFILLQGSRKFLMRRAKRRKRLEPEHYFQPIDNPPLLDGQLQDLELPGPDESGDCAVVNLDELDNGKDPDSLKVHQAILAALSGLGCKLC